MVLSHSAANPPYFRPRRYLLPAPAYRQEMRQRFQSWQEVTDITPAA
jgi:hypothetical protein